jgi:hypothetical protein
VVYQRKTAMRAPWLPLPGLAEPQTLLVEVNSTTYLLHCDSTIAITSLPVAGPLQVSSD